MRQKKSHQKIQDIVVVGLFAALSYLAIMLFRIPYPSPVGNPFLHFGNLFVILCALLFQGWQGGLAGSIGMGLYDITGGYGWLTIKTIILKFGIGWFTGLVAGLGKRRPDQSARPAILFSALASCLLGGLLWYGKVHWEGLVNMSPLAYIFLLVLSAFLLAVGLMAKNIRQDFLFSVLGACSGIAFNVVGEFASGVLLKMLAGSGFQAAAVASIFSLPATLINGVFSIVGALVLLLPLKKGIQAVGYEV